MTKERKIEILMMDGCTKSEGEYHLERGSVVLPDFEEHFTDYMTEWEISEDDIPKYKKMIEDKEPIEDWGVVDDDGNTYYIIYCL